MDQQASVRCHVARNSWWGVFLESLAVLSVGDEMACPQMLALRLHTPGFRHVGLQARNGAGSRFSHLPLFQAKMSFPFSLLFLSP